MTEEKHNVDPIGILVVHGIGAQQRGETLAKLLAGLRRLAPDLPADPVDGRTVKIGGRPVRFYEVYWADLLKGDKIRGTFLMNELQSLTWYPWLNFARRIYAPGSYSIFTVLVCSLVMPIVNLLVLLTYFGARLLVQLFQAAFKKRPRPSGASFAKRVREARSRSTEYTVVDRLLDEFVGDVVNYVNSAGGAFFRRDGEKPVPAAIESAYESIIARFHDELRRASADGCERIQVVAHSLGTVVMYHALRGFKTDLRGPELTAAAARVEHLYTIGSPLEKIRFFWPRLMPDETLADLRTIAWDNFVSWFDPVAGALRRFRDWGPVNNHRLLGGGFIRGHVVYERSPVFLSAFTRGVCGRELSMRRTGVERLRDFLALIGETLLAPVGLLVVLAAGTVILVIAVLLLPYLISLPFRWFTTPEIWGPILDWGALIVGVSMVFSLTVAPLLRAARVHRLFWTRKTQPTDSLR